MSETSWLQSNFFPRRVTYCYQILAVEDNNHGILCTTGEPTLLLQCKCLFFKLSRHAVVRWESQSVGCLVINVYWLEDPTKFLRREKLHNSVKRSVAQIYSSFSFLQSLRRFTPGSFTVWSRFSHLNVVTQFLVLRLGTCLDQGWISKSLRLKFLLRPSFLL
jgi:hypothetical protein